MGPIRVLLLEDDPADARLVELMLRKVAGSPFTVEVATRLAAAVDRLAAGPVDVVLADLSLPDSTGLATLKALTQAAADLPVVVLTGNDDDTQAIDALKHGAQDYLVKGRGDGFILSRVIRYAIERKSGERALKEARDRAEAAVRAKSVFLATIGHEIRTPLNGVLGMARLLLDTNLDQRQRTFTDTVLSSGELLLGLVNDILDFSRLEAEGLTLENVAFDLIDLVEELRLMMAPRAAEKGLTLGCRLPRDDVAMVEGDPLRLRQVLLNLVGNAIKFTERGGVMISVLPDGNAEDGRPIKRFVVADTGQGVPEASRDDLFIEFSQGDSSITRRYGGAGLGLAICKRLVTLMGGEIGFDSVSGQGASFWFTMPLAAATERRPEPVPKVWAATFRILLVDDNAVNREVAAGLLGRHGHEVAAFEDGPGGIAAMAAAEWDLVLLDMHMPDMDGIETARRMRALGGGAASVPIWLLTANPVEQDAKAWRDAGIDGCLAKPFRVEDVAAVLAEGDRVAGPANNSGGARLLNLPDLLADLKDLGHERMKGLADLFERSAGQDLKTVLERARAGDADGLAAIVHRLASAASSLHLVALNERCRAVENAARGHDAAAFALAEGLGDLWTRSLRALSDVVH
jgi:signal transduction histidine kinase/HPt (histidine-containing phosphotransfer) domain-containing protein